MKTQGSDISKKNYEAKKQLVKQSLRDQRQHYDIDGVSFSPNEGILVAGSEETKKPKNRVLRTTG